MRVAVVGGGINGVCCAREAALRGHDVTVFEKGSLLAATSANSSRLLHGGLRYLEQGAFGLVKSSLNARERWLRDCPEHTERIKICLPIYQNNRRPRVAYAAALGLYHLLGIGKNLGPFSYLSEQQTVNRHPSIKTSGLMGAFQFYDGYMNDRALGRWVIDRAMAAGVTFKEYRPVTHISADGSLTASGTDYKFDHIYCCAGPWLKHLANDSQLSSSTELEYVRGSHLVINQQCTQAFMLEVPNSHRFFFVLPHEQGSMIGTTEVHQNSPEPVITSASEVDELIKNYNHYFKTAIDHGDILTTRAGVRPLIKTKANHWASSREAKIEQIDRITLVWGGKWTSAPELANAVIKQTVRSGN